MSGHRKDKLGEEIKRELAQLIHDELKDPRVRGVVSITDVEVSRDLRHANVFVSALGDENALEGVLVGLKKASGFLRSSLAGRLSVRYTPELSFKGDQSIETGARINRILSEQKYTE